MPPAFIEVGAAEPLRDEDMAYAQQRTKAGAPTELRRLLSSR
ncbi:alpha/beta hydrolase fold domain-containing protein [Amycolatopsis sp. Hca4]|nr:alpha/beta hydrolase fold domain-containing protein [Amycolatopsis sp. Hca4]